jgi:protein-disulfide isomerase
VQGISLGRQDAPVVIYEFADYQCPHCMEWVTYIEPLIKERLVDTGVVRYVYYDFPLGGAFRHSFVAARAGRCANEQGKFWEYHDLVYARQATWSPMGDAVDFFVDLGDQVGLNGDQFEECVRSDKYAREVTLSRRLGDQLGVSGTSSLFVNGKRIPDLPRDFSELEAIVRQEAGTAAPAGAPAAGDSATADTGAAAGS